MQKKKQLTDDNAFKEIFLYSISKKKIQEVHKNNAIENIKSYLNKTFKNFPKSIIERKTHQELNKVGYTLLVKGLLGLDLAERKNFINLYNMNQEIKRVIINAHNDEDDEEYQKLSMDDHYLAYDNLMVNIEYKEAFADHNRYERLLKSDYGNDLYLKYKNPNINNTEDFNKYLDVNKEKILNDINSKYTESLKSVSSMTNKFKKLIN